MESKKIILRKEALELGMKMYYTGIPCKNGHTSERFTNDWSCYACRKIVNKSVYFKRREYYIQKTLKWQKDNVEKTREKQRRHNRKYPEKCAEKLKYLVENYKGNKETIKKYKKNNRDKFNSYQNKRRALEIGADGRFCDEDIKIIFKRQKCKCANCKCDISKKYHIDHIMPLSKGGSNWPKNLQLLCPHCNSTKRSKHPIDWAQENGRLL